jgi:hypothetical protein
MRRVTLPAELADTVRDRATRAGLTLSEEVIRLVHAALAEERLPPRMPDSPLERRVQELMGEDRGLTREMAERIARVGGHGH